TGSPSAGDWTAIAGTTRRGYTDQTMLDNVNLTHMNGRVYDQVLGRFLSADPFITEPLTSQNYNRYSYVNNNPLVAIDPSGFQIVLTGQHHYGPDAPASGAFFGGISVSAAAAGIDDFTRFTRNSGSNHDSNGKDGSDNDNLETIVVT